MESMTALVRAEARFLLAELIMGADITLTARGDQWQRQRPGHQ